MNAWDALEDPLTVRDMQRLVWLREKIAAVIWLDQCGTYRRPIEAQRLAFARYLFTTRRLREFGA